MFNLEYLVVVLIYSILVHVREEELRPRIEKSYEHTDWCERNQDICFLALLMIRSHDIVVGTGYTSFGRREQSRHMEIIIRTKEFV